MRDELLGEGRVIVMIHRNRVRHEMMVSELCLFLWHVNGDNEVEYMANG